jgi:hypothetical protein
MPEACATCDRPRPRSRSGGPVLREVARRLALAVLGVDVLAPCVIRASSSGTSLRGSRGAGWRVALGVLGVHVRLGLEQGRDVVRRSSTPPRRAARTCRSERAGSHRRPRRPAPGRRRCVPIHRGPQRLRVLVAALVDENRTTSCRPRPAARGREVLRRVR